MIRNEKVKAISGIYVITNLVNNKIYVGSSVDLLDRYFKHKYDLIKNTHHNYHLQQSWNKYGEDNFSFSVLELVNDKNKLIEREQYWMDKLNACDKNKGYNINPVAGSSMGRKLSDDKRKEFMLSQKSRPILQFDVNGYLIKEWYSVREICREFNIERYTVISKLKNKTSINNSYLFYKDEFTDDLLRQCSLGKGKKINQYDKNGMFIRVWNSITLASKSLNIDQSSINRCCLKGRNRKTAGGFIWSFVD